MSKRTQVQKSEMSPEAKAADDQGTHSNLATVESGGAVVVASAPFRLKRTRAIALPLMKFIPDKPRYFKAETPMFDGKKIDDKKEVATLMNVTDLETGELGQIIVGTVLKELLNETYPGDAFIGLCFEMTLRKRADKKYNTYDLYEVEA